jgi:hypothetical protein
LILPPLRTKPLTIHGVDGDMAVELPRHFVECWLQDVSLVDGNGWPVELPPVAKTGT